MTRINIKIYICDLISDVTNPKNLFEFRNKVDSRIFAMVKFKIKIMMSVA